MKLNKYFSRELLIESTKKTLSLYFYILSNKKTFAEFLLGSLCSISAIIAITEYNYNLTLWDFPFISVLIIFLCINFFVIGIFYYLLYKKSYNRAHIFNLGKKDLRDFPIIWNRVHLFQLIIVIILYKYMLVNSYSLCLTYIFSYFLVFIMYLSTNIIIRKKSIESGRSLFVPSVSDYNKEVDSDNYFNNQHNIVGKHRTFKKRINNELRNSIYCESNVTKIVLNKPIQPSQIEISVATDLIIKSNNHVEIFFDGKVVLKKRISLLHSGWNDFRGLSTVYGKSEVNEIVIKLKNRNTIYFSYKKKKIVKQKNQRNIIVLLIDGLRKDMIGIYNSQQYTPSINRFFSNYTKYENAYVQGEWTLPTFASMVTSLYSSHHRVIHPDYSKTRQLPIDVNTYIELLQKNGYYTLSYASTPRASHLLGYQRGNDSLFYLDDIRDTRSIILNTIDFLNVQTDVNKFVSLHLMDLRTPIKMKSPLCWDNLSLVNNNDLEILNNSKDFEYHDEEKYFADMYINKVKEIDLLLGLLFDKIENSDLKSNTTVILTSDHGINLPTDNVENWRKKQFSKERMQVPLLLRCPWKPESFNKAYSGFVESSIDLYPTILELSNTNVKSSIYSKSILPDQNGNYIGKDYVVSEMLYKGRYDCRIMDDDFEYYKSFNWTENGPIEEKLKERKAGAFLDISDSKSTVIINKFRSIVANLQLLTNRDDLQAPFYSMSSFI